MVSLRDKRAVAYKAVTVDGGFAQNQLLPSYIGFTKGNGIGHEGTIANFEQGMGNAAGSGYFGVFANLRAKHTEVSGYVNRCINRVHNHQAKRHQLVGKPFAHIKYTVNRMLTGRYAALQPSRKQNGFGGEKYDVDERQQRCAQQ